MHSLETSPRRWAASAAAVALAVTAAAPTSAQVAAAQSDSAVLTALSSWIALPAEPGRERAATDFVRRAEPAWRRDALGSLVLTRGAGRPRRVVACALDEAGYAVSEITADGYLRVHEAGNARRHPLWDQFHEGQRIVVRTARGAVPGVMAVRSTHLWRGRRPPESPTSIEQLWVDVGARSRADVQALGISLLDPVERDWPPWRYGGLVAGPAAADRAGCAAVAAAARGTPTRGQTVFVLAAQSAFGWAGLGAVVSRLGGADTVVIASARVPLPGAVADTGDAVRAHTIAAPFQPIPGLVVGATVALTVRRRFPGTLVESISADDARRYVGAVAGAAGVTGGALPELPVPGRSGGATARRTGLDSAAALLTTLADTYGVSRHERLVRDAIRDALPAWARARLTSDSIGNLVLAIGPDRDTAVFVAHQDEVGFEVAGIAGDGTVSLRRRGGFFESLWEGQTALLQLDHGGASGTLRGVFVPRDSATVKQPGEVTAWFGVDSATLVARGVAVGDAVTSAKAAARLGKTRFTARSLDDRTGCAALILAVRALDPARLTHKVIFAWSVQEEIGLFGAAVLADRWRGSVRRVYAVDTFVSSDSPLERSRFALAPIGSGAVARALDNSSATPPDEVERVRAIAARSRIPLQVGTTNGGNDGSTFVRFGVLDVPLGWPLRYSHSPAELIDLRDVVSLADLVHALAASP